MAIEGFAELIWTMGGAAALALIGWGGRRVAADRAIADARANAPRARRACGRCWFSARLGLALSTAP
jgi:hypothetical protein